MINPLHSSIQTGNQLAKQPVKAPESAEQPKRLPETEALQNKARIDSVNKLANPHQVTQFFEQQQQSRNTIYDQPSFKSSNAIATYSEIENQQQRAEVQSLIGVDVYA